MNRNILFYIEASNSPLYGGIQRVSMILAKNLIDRGYKVYSLSTSVDETQTYTESFALPEPYAKSDRNVEYIRTLVKSLGIDIIIVTTVSCPATLYHFMHLGMDVKIISHYHFSPKKEYSRHCRFNGKPFSRTRAFQEVAFLYNRILLWRTHLFDNICGVSDRIVVMDRHYIREMKLLADIPTDKFAVIPNPLTYQMDMPVDVAKKEKTVLWVGRLVEEDKRISSLLNVWKLASPEMPGWRLQIVGGGTELELWKSQAAGMGLERYEFVGPADPRPYYEKASIYTLTSNAEAWSMTLLEAMSNSCAPILFNSYAAAESIISDKENGILIRPFNDRRFARELVHLAKDENFRKRIAANAYLKTKQYGTDGIVDLWEKIFE